MAMLIMQVVGYQNSGKTTIIEKCVKEFAFLGIKVGVLKHHGHGGTPDVYQKDSVRHFQAGAKVSAVAGEGALLLHARIDESKSLVKFIELYQHFFEIEVLFIEGYKNLSYPKIVCLRDENDLDLLELPNIQAIASRKPMKKKRSFILGQDDDLLINWLKNYLHINR